MKTAALTASLILALATLTAMPASAQNYTPVTDKATFLQAMGGRNLTNRLYGINLAVTPDGRISGSGGGWDITGTWAWEGGLFCREMSWGGDPIPYSCQSVGLAGNDMQFINQADGETAAFTLR